MMVLRCLLRILALLPLCAPFVTIAASSHVRLLSHCLNLPPAIRLVLGQEQGLRQDCENNSIGSCLWETTIQEGYELATRIFQEIATGCNNDVKSKTLWFPKMQSMAMLDCLIELISANSEKLGEVQGTISSWPQSPATKLVLTWNNQLSEKESFVSREYLHDSVSATEEWVVSTLCRLKLCPHTVSLQRGAVGLEHANVKEGPVVVRHTQSMIKSSCRAAAATAAFWECVSEIAATPESELATILLIVPASYDHSFLEFATLCDNLIEPSVKITGADSVIGRAWFHPEYATATIGHETIIPGHALPASMVSGYIQNSIGATKIPAQSDIVWANDVIRRTPFSTINLLRRSQLTAAKVLEAQLANSKPNAIYAKNVMRILADS